MTVYVLSFDMNQSAGHARLHEELERRGAHRALKSLWLLEVENTAPEVRDYFKRYLGTNEGLWVSELTSQYAFKNAEIGSNTWLQSNPPAR